MSEPEDIEIEGVRFRMVKLGGLAGRALSARVMRSLGAMAGVLADPEALSGAKALGLFAHVDEADINAIADILGKVSQVEVAPGKWRHLTPQVVDEVFAGRPKLQFFWLGHALRFQLADFFG
jgi:hypothetical protein